MHTDRSCGCRHRRRLVVVAVVVVDFVNFRWAINAGLHRHKFVVHPGIDRGSQYPSALFSTDDAQKNGRARGRPASGAVLDRRELPPIVGLSCAPVTPSAAKTRLCVRLRRLRRFAPTNTARHLENGGQDAAKGSLESIRGYGAYVCVLSQLTEARSSSQRPRLSVVRLAMLLPRLVITAPNRPPSLPCLLSSSLLLLRRRRRYCYCCWIVGPSSTSQRSQRS